MASGCSSNPGDWLLRISAQFETDEVVEKIIITFFGFSSTFPRLVFERGSRQHSAFHDLVAPMYIQSDKYSGSDSTRAKLIMNATIYLITPEGQKVVMVFVLLPEKHQLLS